jgi:hypothetical protein
VLVSFVAIEPRKKTFTSVNNCIEVKLIQSARGGISAAFSVKC